MTEAQMFTFNTFLKARYEITESSKDCTNFKDLYDDFCTWIQQRYSKLEVLKYSRTLIYTALRELPDCVNERTKKGFMLRFIKKKNITEDNTPNSDYDEGKNRAPELMNINPVLSKVAPPIIDNVPLIESSVVVTNHNPVQIANIVPPKIQLKLVIQTKPQVNNITAHTQRQSRHQIFTAVPPLRAPFETAVNNTRPPLLLPTLNRRSIVVPILNNK